jgi:hypothetical protein
MQVGAKGPDVLLPNKLLFGIGETGELLGKSRFWVNLQMKAGRIRYVPLGPRRNAITRGEILRIASEGVGSGLPSQGTQT